MREYSAISVSAADATSLANRLTEQAQQGWSLVQIVHNNDQVVAYLEREGSGAGTADAGTPSDSFSSGATSSPAVSASYGSVPDSSTSFGSISDGSTSDGSTPDTSTSDGSSSWGSMPVAAATETVTAFQDDAGNAAIVDQSTYSMGVPAAGASTETNPGWGAGAVTGAASGLAASASQTASDAASDAQNQVADAANSATDAATSSFGSYGDTAAGAVGGVVGSAHDSSSGAAHSGASGDQGDSQTPASGIQGGSASSGGMAPAGWYADPAGRFELRYWDGTQWTEHVASGSEQDTDPPVKNAD